MSNEWLNSYSDMSDVFEIEKDEEEVAIKPYEVDCLPNDYNITTLISLIERGYLKYLHSNEITYGRKTWLLNLLNQLLSVCLYRNYSFLKGNEIIS